MAGWSLAAFLALRGIVCLAVRGNDSSAVPSGNGSGRTELPPASTSGS